MTITSYFDKMCGYNNNNNRLIMNYNILQILDFHHFRSVKNIACYRKDAQMFPVD